jgi:hypothetical protein
VVPLKECNVVGAPGLLSESENRMPPGSLPPVAPPPRSVMLYTVEPLSSRLLYQGVFPSLPTPSKLYKTVSAMSALARPPLQSTAADNAKQVAHRFMASFPRSKSNSVQEITITSPIGAIFIVVR